ncbi:hypothetical protein ZHAS_00021979 [Anopheles sinensis]|uniref:Uncharacterized protein n=1 Tax=Anopheles sinensis TaxID=74873 RepID=A0A084WTC8_ANOSI|nr:hypothetical protein ZHAS_00021979 [Anopheles sinensis]
MMIVRFESYETSSSEVRQSISPCPDAPDGSFVSLPRGQPRMRERGKRKSSETDIHPTTCPVREYQGMLCRGVFTATFEQKQDEVLCLLMN